MKQHKKSIKRLLGYRFLAYTVDFLVMLLFVMAFQFGFRYVTGGAINDSLTTPLMLYGWVLLTITAPVYLYFILSEYSRAHATMGKKLFGLRVISNKGKVSGWQSVVRNFVKVTIPWEATHLALFFPTPILADSTPEFRATLFIPYVIFGIYGAYLLFTKGRTTLHDAIAGTNVQYTK